MDAVKTLIRTVVRSFYSNPKQILIVDALLIHSVLHVDDFNVLLATQQKEIRKLLAPLKKAYLLDTQTKVEAKVGQLRGSARDYYYIPFHPAIDAIKYRISKLTERVKDLYQLEATRKEWRCPYCKAEYDTYQVLNSVNDEGFACERCSTTLEETPQAKDAAGMVGHEKHSQLMTQLGKILSLMQQVDRLKVPENDFESAWEKKKEVPRDRSQHARKEYVAVPGAIKFAKAGRSGPEKIKTESLDVSLTSGEEHDAADQQRREARKAELAKQNMLPIWHTQSTVTGTEARARDAEVTMTNGDLIKKEADVVKAEEEEGDEEEAGEKKSSIDEEDDLAAYMVEMKREREEAERKAAEEDFESDDDGDEDDDFEDVISTAVATPQTQPPPAAANVPSTSDPVSSLSNGHGRKQEQGIKREYDGDDESGPSSDDNTPAGGDITPGVDSSDAIATKRIKLENGADGLDGGQHSGLAVAGMVESEKTMEEEKRKEEEAAVVEEAVVKEEEDEDDEDNFEDAM